MSDRMDKTHNHRHRLPANDSSPAKIRKKHTDFRWLKAPSILLIFVGIIGILCEESRYFKSAFSFLQLPPLGYSLIITALAGVLLVISFTATKGCGDRDADVLHDNWRSI